MIVTDLDGTLLNEAKTVSEFSKEILKQCKNRGIKIVYATGRGSGSNKIVPMELFDGYIVNNGALAYADEKLVYNSLIPYEALRPVLLACDRRGLKAAAQLENIHYSNFDVAKEWPEFRDFEITDFSKHTKDTEKMYAVLNNNEDITVIEKHLTDEIYLSVSRDGFAQIMHINATKSKALNALATHWNITQEEIVAFGDDLNDLDLLLYAGTGVAMGNAVEEVKAEANQICLTNDQNGLAVWLKENVL